MGSQKPDTGHTPYIDGQSSLKDKAASRGDGSVSGRLASEEDAEQRYSEDITAEGKFNRLVQASGSMAHEFNNLLTTILANVQLASLAVENEKAKSYLDAAEEATGVAGKIVRKFQEAIRDLARPGAQS